MKRKASKRMNKVRSFQMTSTSDYTVRGVAQQKVKHKDPEDRNGWKRRVGRREEVVKRIVPCGRQTGKVRNMMELMR